MEILFQTEIGWLWLRDNIDTKTFVFRNPTKEETILFIRSLKIDSHKSLSLTDIINEYLVSLENQDKVLVF